MQYSDRPPSNRGRSKSRRRAKKSSSPSNESSKQPSRAPTPPSEILTSFNPKSPSSSLSSAASSRSSTPTPVPVRSPIRSLSPPVRSPIRSPSPPVRSPPIRTPSPRLPVIVYPKQTIHDIHIGEIQTEVKMTPPWFEQEDQQEALKNIVYPRDVTDSHSFDSVARYRATIQKTNNFQKKSIESGVNRAETLMIALDKFAQQLGGDLSFTKYRIPTDENVRRTACGIGSLESVHLLATNHILTARFVLRTDLNYKRDLAKSPETMANFTLTFAAGIAKLLKCHNEYVRVMSIEENDEDDGNAQVDFGITTPEQVNTEMLADDLSVRIEEKK